MRKRSAFTLIELIIVIAIIAVLMATIFVSLDPARRLHASRNLRRHSDVIAISTALVSRLADNKTITAVDTDPSTWQMLGVGNDCNIANCEAGDDGILSI